jgi:hypothetical protein
MALWIFMAPPKVLNRKPFVKKAGIDGFAGDPRNPSTFCLLGKRKLYKSSDAGAAAGPLREGRFR